MTFLKTEDGIYESSEPLPCPQCDSQLHYGHIACTADDHEVPQPGDFGLCHRCAYLFMLGADLLPVEPTIDQLVKAQGSPTWEVIEEEQERIKQRIRNTGE